MRTSSAPALKWSLLGLVACTPPEPPAWVVGFPLAWGIEVRVVEDGLFAADLVVPDGHSRADVLPYDTVEWRWFGAAPEGSSVHPPIWVAVPADYEYGLSALMQGELPACPEPLPLTPPLCRLGVGERIRVRLSHHQSLRSTGEFSYQSLRVLTIASDGDVTDPETCLRLALNERGPDLSGCLFTTRTAGIGPRGALWRILGFPPQLDPVAGELAFEVANLNPAIEAIELTRMVDDDELISLARDGDEIAVRRGERITVKLRLDAGAAQKTLGGSVNQEGVAKTYEGEERVTVIGRFSEPVDHYAPSDDGLVYTWTVDATTTLYVQVADDRGGRAFVNLRFVVGEAP